MKVLILSNVRWNSWNTKIQSLKDWFKGTVELDVTVKDVSLSPIFTGFKGNDGITRYYSMNKAWITQNIIPLAKGYDVVIFTMSNSENKMFPVQASSIGAINGIQVIHGGCNEFDNYNFNGVRYDGDIWFNIMRHELCHALYDIQGKTDNTHKYWEDKTIEKCLTEIKSMKYKYFSDKEIIGLKPELVLLLDQAREIAGIPFKLNSGKRTVEQNEKAGGVKDSAHLSGLAVDIACTTDSARDKILNSLRVVGFNRIGIAKTFIHCDIDKTKSPNRTWLYD